MLATVDRVPTFATDGTRMRGLRRRDMSVVPRDETQGHVGGSARRAERSNASPLDDVFCVIVDPIWQVPLSMGSCGHRSQSDFFSER
jgi:hypothetical protein